MMSKSMVRQVAIQAVLFAAAALLGLVIFGFLVAALLIALLEVMYAPLALLLTATVLAFFVLLLVMIARSTRSRRRHHPKSADVDLAALLQLAVGRQPWGSIATSLALGAVAELTMKRSATRRRD